MMSSALARRIPSPSMLATQAALTARNAGCEISEVDPESRSCVDSVLQSSSIQKASGEPLQSPFGQERGGAVIAAGTAVAPGATEPTSPSSISLDSASPDPPPLSPQPDAIRLALASTKKTPLDRFRISNMFAPPRLAWTLPRQQAQCHNQ